MNENKLSVYLYGKPIGLLEREKNLKMTFTYKKDATTSLSLALPLKEKAFDSHLCKVFFSALLPESNQARQNISRILNIDQQDTFSFLKEMGQDCAGAVTFHPYGTRIEPQESYPLKGRILSQFELEQYLSMLPNRQYLVGLDGLRATLSGVQDKALVCLIEGKIAIPVDGCPTTHIIKVSTPKKTVLNEYLCLKIAQRLGIEVPCVELRHVGKTVFLLIKRFDRVSDENGIKRLHQEDFCQALGILPHRKYQYDGGPSLEDCFDLLKKTIIPAIDRNRLMQIVIFNYLTANFFAHGKNYSLLYLPNNQFRLAPFYDLHCGYQEFEQGQFAMAISGKFQPIGLTSFHWQQLCYKVGYAYPAFKKMLFETIESILKLSEAEKNELKVKCKSAQEAEKIDTFLQRHADEIIKNFDS